MISFRSLLWTLIRKHSAKSLLLYFEPTASVWMLSKSGFPFFFRKKFNYIFPALAKFLPRAAIELPSIELRYRLGDEGLKIDRTRNDWQLKVDELAEETKLSMKINVVSFTVSINIEKGALRTNFRKECTHCCSMHLHPVRCTEINRLSCSLVRRRLLIYRTDLNMRGTRCFEPIMSTSHNLLRYLKYLFPYPLLLPLPPSSPGRSSESQPLLTAESTRTLSVILSASLSFLEVTLSNSWHTADRLWIRFYWFYRSFTRFSLCTCFRLCSSTTSHSFVT